MSVQISIDKTITFCFAHIPTQYIIDQLPTRLLLWLILMDITPYWMVHNKDKEHEGLYVVNDGSGTYWVLFIY